MNSSYGMPTLQVQCVKESVVWLDYHEKDQTFRSDITKPRNSETKQRNTETPKHRNTETPKRNTETYFFPTFFLDQRKLENIKILENFKGRDRGHRGVFLIVNLDEVRKFDSSTASCLQKLSAKFVPQFSKTKSYKELNN